MILLDAYAVLALAREEAAAGEVAEIVRSQDVAMSTANFLEVAEQLIRLYGWTPTEASGRLGALVEHKLHLVPLDGDVAWRGALLRARYYHRRTRNLSLADCALLASAGTEETITTSDPTVAAVARAEGIRLIALPNSSGQRP